MMKKARLLGIIALVTIIGVSMTGCPTANTPTITPEPTVTSVTVSPATANVVRGESQYFTATVLGTSNPPTTVTWEVDGGVSGTAISGDGRLAVAVNETATSLAVRAISTFDLASSGTATVTVVGPGHQVIPITNAAIAVSTPVTGATPSTIASGIGNFIMGAVSWSPTHSSFQGNTVYTATVVLTANTGFTFAGGLTGTVTINGYSVTPMVASGGMTATLSHTFAPTVVGLQPITNAAITVTAPVTDQVPNTVASGTGDFSIGAVSWSPNHNPFQGNTAYTATVVLTANTGFTFTDGLTGTVSINGYSVTPIVASGGMTATLSHTFAPTVVGLQPITNAAITVSAPVTDQVPNTAASGTGDFSIGAVSWSPNHNPFQGNTAYTATVVLTANTGFTFAGGLTGTVTINGYSVTPMVASGGMTATLSYTFAPTVVGLQPIANAAITVTAPVTGAIPNTVASGTGDFSIGAVSWSPAHSSFQGNTAYTVTVVLTANTGFTFAGGLTGTVSINGYSVTPIVASGGMTATLSHTFAPTVVGLQPISNAAITVTAPVTGAIPNTVASGTGDFSIGAVSWSPIHSSFQGNTAYTATVVLTANTGFTFAGGLTGIVTINGNSVLPIVTNNGGTVTLSYTFAPTGLMPIANAAITVTTPVTDQVPNTVASGTGDFSIGAVSWSPAHNPFQGGTAYTATVELTANTGFTFTGGLMGTVAINGQTATVANNTGATVTLSHTFEPTDLTPIENAAITVTAPVTGAIPNTIAGGTGNFTVGAVSWSPAHNPFQGGTAYTAMVELTANTGFTFTGGLMGTVAINGQTAMVTNNTGATVTLSHAFPVTLLTPITNAEITVTAPVTGATPNATASGTGDFTLGAVSWSPNRSPFRGNTAYTATVTLTANTGFTFADGLTGTVTINETTITPTIAGNGTTATLSHTFAPTDPETHPVNGFTITFAHFADPGLGIGFQTPPSIANLLAAPVTINVAPPANYEGGSIRWILNNVDITDSPAVSVDNRALTLRAPVPEYLPLRIGGNSLTTTIRIGGVSYSRTVTFDVR